MYIKEIYTIISSHKIIQFKARSEIREIELFDENNMLVKFLLEI